MNQNPIEFWQTRLSQILPGANLNVAMVISNIVEIFLLLVGVVAVIFLIYGGYMYITAGGNLEQAATAKTTIFNSIIGLAIVLAAWAIVNFVGSQLTQTNQQGPVSPIPPNPPQTTSPIPPDNQSSNQQTPTSPIPPSD